MPIIQQPNQPLPAPAGRSGFQLEQAFNRARAHLNDSGIQIWTDTQLAEFAKEAYSWVVNEIGVFSDPAIEKVSPDPGVAYTPGPNPGWEQSLVAIQPVDMLVPI